MRRFIKWSAIALVAAVVVAQFLPDEIRIPGRWPPHVPRVEVVQEDAQAPRRSYAAMAASAESAAMHAASVPPAPVEQPVPPPPLPDTTAVVARQAAPPPARPKKKLVRRAPAKPVVEPEPEVTWFEQQPSNSVVTSRITTEVRLSSPSLEDSGATLAPAITAKDSASVTHWPILCGVVVDVSGEPVPDATVQIDGVDLVEHTDPKGLFCLPCPPGRREVIAGTESRGSVRIPVLVDGTKPQVRITLAPSR